MSLIYLKAPHNEIYKIGTTLVDFGFNSNLCVLYIYIKIYMVRCEKTILVERDFYTRNIFIGGQLPCTLNLTVFNGRHWWFDFF